MTAGRLLLLVILVLGASPCARADDAQLWITVGVASPARNPWRATFEVQPRWTGDMTEFNRMVYRAQAGRAISGRLAAWIGYERTDAAGLRARDEHRLYQQAVLIAPISRWVTTHRFRIEERFLARTDRMAARLRYQIRAARALGNRRVWSVFGTDELFVALNTVDRGPHRGFDQNRWSVGVGRLVTPAVLVEPAYSQQIVRTPRLRTHAVQITITTRL